MGGGRDLRYVYKAYRHILSCSVSSLQQKEKLFSVIFSRSDHTLPSSQLANFISCSLQEGMAEIFISKLQAGVGASVTDEMFPAFRVIPHFGGKKTHLSSVSLYWMF